MLIETNTATLELVILVHFCLLLRHHRLALFHCCSFGCCRSDTLTDTQTTTAKVVTVSLSLLGFTFDPYKWKTVQRPEKGRSLWTRGRSQAPDSCFEQSCEDVAEQGAALLHLCTFDPNISDISSRPQEVGLKNIK